MRYGLINQDVFNHFFNKTWNELDPRFFFGTDSALASRQLPSVQFVPRADVTETDKAYTLRFDLPGLTKDEIQIKANAQELTVSGERKQMTETENEKRHVIETRAGFFQRSFELPQDADLDQTSAEFINGVLSVTVQKKAAAQPKVITIKSH